MGLARKLKRKSEAEQKRYLSDVKGEARRIADLAVKKAADRAYKAGSDQAVSSTMWMVLAVASEIIYNDFGRLQKKETRLQQFVEMLNERLQQAENPSERQLEVERLLDERCGICIRRIEQ